MSKVLELFGTSTSTKQTIDWQKIVSKQICIFSGKGCFKVRKSQPNIAIGTCSVAYGKDDGMIIICPNRLLEANQVFLDAMHLLTNHEPGNQIHVVPEISIPGGSVDYFLVSVKNKKVMDFVGVEFQTLDTTGTVWPERQRFLKEKGFRVAEKDVSSEKSFGMNWKMTAKTILIQLHHKVQTFEEINKHFLLVIQDNFFDYMKKEFRFDHLNSARLGRSNAYKIGVWRGGTGALIAQQARNCGIEDRVFLCDTFTGVFKAGEKDNHYKDGEHADTSVQAVANLIFTRMNLTNVEILEGLFPDQTGHKVKDLQFRFCHIDVDVYQSAKDIVDWIWNKMVPGGIIVFDDYGFDSCKGITIYVEEQMMCKDRIVIHNLNGHAIVVKL